MKTFDIQLRVPPELMSPLLELCAGDIRVNIIHIGQTLDDKATAPAPPRKRHDNNHAWVAKVAPGVMAALRELARQGDNVQRGVYYLDLGQHCLKAGSLTSAESVSAVLSALVRAGRARKISRGRYFPV